MGWRSGCSTSAHLWESRLNLISQIRDSKGLKLYWVRPGRGCHIRAALAEPVTCGTIVNDPIARSRDLDDCHAVLVLCDKGEVKYTLNFELYT